MTSKNKNRSAMQTSPAFLENPISILSTYWQASQELQFCKATQSSKPALKWMTCCLQCFVSHTEAYRGLLHLFFPYWKTIHLHVNLLESQPEKGFFVLNRFFILTLIVIHIFLSQCRMTWVPGSPLGFHYTKGGISPQTPASWLSPNSCVQSTAPRATFT